MSEQNVIDAYPLQWPAGWKKTNTYNRATPKFVEKSFAVVRDLLMTELKRFRARNIILSTNIPLRKDGLPYSGYRQPDDVGVAVYFKLSNYENGKTTERPMVFACDKWRKIEQNIYAIYLTIEALRGIERWGSSDLMERSFTGFVALPPPAKKRDWWDVLEVRRDASSDVIRANYLRLVREHHPDHGGSSMRAAEINNAYEEATKR